MYYITTKGYFRLKKKKKRIITLISKRGRHLSSECLQYWHVPLGGGGSGFLGTATGSFFSGIAFFGTSGTLKILVYFSFRNSKIHIQVLRTEKRQKHVDMK